MHSARLPQVSAPRLKVFSWPRWTALAALIFLLVGFVAVGTSWPRIQAWNWVHAVGPELEREFGFRGGYISWQNQSGRTSQLFGVVEVEPGGAFEAAGIQPNDVISGWFWGFRDEFYSALAKARETGSVEIPYIPVQEINEKDFRYYVRKVQAPTHARVGAKHFAPADRGAAPLCR